MKVIIWGLACLSLLTAVVQAQDEAPPAPPEATPPPTEAYPPQPTAETPNATAPEAEPPAAPASADQADANGTEEAAHETEGQAPDATTKDDEASDEVHVGPSELPDETAAQPVEQTGALLGTAFVCVVEDDVPVIECVSMDGARRRFELAAPSAAPGNGNVHGSSYSAPADLGSVQTPVTGPILAAVGLVSLGAGAVTASFLRERRSTPVAAAKSFLRALDRTPVPAVQEAPPRLEALVERTREDPTDAEAHFELAMELFERGDAEVALRLFERAVHLCPEVLVPFLNDPRYEAHRERPEVRLVLRNVWRDRERRFTGYV